MLDENTIMSYERKIQPDKMYEENILNMVFFNAIVRQKSVNVGQTSYFTRQNVQAMKFQMLLPALVKKVSAYLMKLSGKLVDFIL